jgi:hypothetical protein
MALGTIPTNLTRMSNRQKADLMLNHMAGKYVASGNPGAWSVGQPYWVRLPYVFIAGGTVQDTGYDLPATGLVTDIVIQVVTLDATETIDVGLLAGESGGDEDGFCALMPISGAAGFYRPGYTITTTWPSASTRGALLGYFVAGSGTDDRGAYIEKPHVISSIVARSVTYTCSSSDVGAGYIWLKLENVA